MNLSEDSRFQSIDKRLCGPIVYIIHEGDTILYIGSSGRGLGRTFSFDHRHRNIINKAEVSVMFCQSNGEAKAIEKELINLHKPRENKEWQRNIYDKPKRKIKVEEVKPIDIKKLNNYWKNKDLIELDAVGKLCSRIRDEFPSLFDESGKFKVG